MYVEEQQYLYSFSFRVKILFMFDKKFTRAPGFNKNTQDKMNQIMALVRNSFRDRSLKNSLGTTINIIGTKKKYKKTLTNNK